MTSEEKAQIDSMSYADMLYHVRFEPLGSAFFNSGTELGAYTWQKYQRLCLDTSQDERVAASKSIGWGGNDL